MAEFKLDQAAAGPARNGECVVVDKAALKSLVDGTLAEALGVAMRADASPGASVLSEDQKPPELAADTAVAAKQVMAAALDAIRREAILDRYRRAMAKLDEMEERIDAVQRKEDARQALLRAEADPETAVARLDPAPPRLASEDNLPPAHPHWKQLH
jgi:hypothetical protein